MNADMDTEELILSFFGNDSKIAVENPDFCLCLDYECNGLIVSLYFVKNSNTVSVLFKNVSSAEFV